MEIIFMSFLLTSLIATVLSFVLTIIKPVTIKFFSTGWHYYMWLIVLIIMIFPIRLNLPETPSDTSPVSEIVVNKDNNSQNQENFVAAGAFPVTDTHDGAQQEKISSVHSINKFFDANLNLISFIWIAGAVLLFMIKLISYLVFLVKIHKHSTPVSCPEIRAYTKRNVRTRISGTICSPVMIGVIRPTLLLPETSITPEQLNNILAHEVTHLKRNDILYKWFVNIVKCVHWFNPVVYYISKRINVDCEVSCDLAVTAQMDEQSKIEYVETILTLLSNNSTRAISLSTGMTGSKKLLKLRFTMIKNKKQISKIAKNISFFVSILTLSASIFISGVMAAGIFNEYNSEYLPEIEIKHNGYLLQLTNKPFFKNDEIYLPLREILEKAGVMENEGGYIKWNDGKITICITEGVNIPQYDYYGNIIDNKPTTLQYYYGIEIGKAEYILNPPGTLPEERHHLSQSKKMANAPILKNGITYIPYEYVDYMINRVMRNHKLTLGDDTFDTNSKHIDNAESLSYEDIKNLQIAADNGHFSWRLNPAEVVSSFLLSKGKTSGNIRLPKITGDTIVYTDDNIEIELVRPIDKSEKGIWIVKTYKEIKNIGFVWPSESKTISREFGKKVHPITGEEIIHNGIDISANENSPVFSASYGEITDTGFDNEFGNYIVVENNNGVKTYYGHLSSVGVKKGDKVKQGDVIAKVGKTGIATGVNLHFEIQINGKYCDPQQIWHDVNVTRGISELSDEEKKSTQSSIASNSGEKSDIKIKTAIKSDKPHIVLSHLSLKQGIDFDAIEKSLKKSGITNSKSSYADLTKNYLLGKCKSDYRFKTRCDDNGNITLYFDATENDYVDIVITDSQTGSVLAEYGVMPDTSKSYSFMGFEKDKDYNMEFQQYKNKDINYIVY